MNDPENFETPRVRKWGRIVALIALGFVITVMISIWAANDYLSRNSQEILRRLGEQTGLDIQVGSFKVDWRLHRPQIRLGQVQIRSNATLMTASSLRMEIRVRESIIRGDLRLREVEVQELSLSLPLVIDQPFSSSSQGAVSVSDSIKAWQRFSQVIDVLILSDAIFGVQTSTGNTLSLMLASLRLSGDQHSGQVYVAASVNERGDLNLTGDWTVSSDQEFSLASRLKITDFPAPLFHKGADEFELLKPNLPGSACEDYGTLPCVRIRQLQSNLRVDASEKSLKLALNDLSAATDKMSASGNVAIASSGDAVEFDVDIQRAQATLQAALAIVDDQWIGEETYRWLLAAIPATKASQGKVRIAGATDDRGFSDFEIRFDAQAPRLVFADGWPAVSDLNAKVRIGADQIEVNVASGRYGDLPLRDGNFLIPSFSKSPLMAEVTAQTSANLSEVFANLDASPIGIQIANIRTQLDQHSNASLTATVALHLNLSHFEREGVRYRVDLKSSSADISLLDGVFAFKESDIAMVISGQASEQMRKLELNGSVLGRSVGRWRLADKPCLRWDLNIEKPWMGLRVAIGSDSKIQLPSNAGLKFELPDITGNVRLENLRKNRHFAAKFQRLVIPKLEPTTAASEPTQKTVSKTKSALDPVMMPSIDVDIGQFEYSGLELGRIKLGARHSRAGLFELTGAINAPRVSLELDDGEWLRGEGGPTSFVRGRLVMKDTGAVLSKLGLFDGLKSGDSIHDFDLKWPGAPWDFSAAEAKGFLRSKMSGGELMSVDSFFVKLIDILTLKSFKFYEKGSKIEKVDANLKLDSGKLIIDLVDLDLSSTNLKFKGEADLIKETLATDVGMEVKIGEAVGTAAAVVTMGPIGIALGYLSSKTELKLPSLDVLNQLTAFSYRLEGSWQDPQLKSFRPKPFGI